MLPKFSIIILNFKFFPTSMLSIYIVLESYLLLLSFFEQDPVLDFFRGRSPGVGSTFMLNASSEAWSPPDF